MQHLFADAVRYVSDGEQVGEVGGEAKRGEGERVSNISVS